MNIHGRQALDRLLAQPDIQSVLDVGSGQGEHARIMREAGRDVYTISRTPPADFVGDYMDTSFSDEDAIWASHVLEHVENVGAFLRKCFHDLRPSGLLAITIPPAKHNVVGGHLNLFNAGTLVYNLILAGFDCSEAQVSPLYPCYEGGMPYNISVLVRKKEAHLPPDLEYDNGDIEKLAHFFPVPAKQDFDGRFTCNWE